MSDKSKWHNDSYRRCLVDMHISDSDVSFLSRLDTRDYARMMAMAEVQTAYVYANSHTGLCYWPTKSGQMHKNLGGRDLFGELVASCRHRSVGVVAYYSVIYNNWAYEEHPEWRMVDSAGGVSRDEGKKPNFTNRYGLCCPNSEAYCVFIRNQLSEIMSSYTVEGIFIDMTFWPTICYCNNCSRKFAEAFGKPLPREVDWSSDVWRSFHSLRRLWIQDFARMISRHIWSIRPAFTVTHNFASSLGHWLPAVDDGIVTANDYISGDLYGGAIEQSFASKLFYSLTRSHPFDYMSSRCDPDLMEHTTIKSEDALALHASIAIAHGGAFTAIDAIEPSGEMNEAVYRRLGKVFGRTRMYEKEIGGSLVQDVAIYFSFNSKMEGGNSPSSTEIYWGDVLGVGVRHTKIAVQAAKALKEYHVPFGVISKALIGSLHSYGVIVVPGVDEFDDEEIHAFRSYVESGGNLYLSGVAAARAFGEGLGLRLTGRMTVERTYLSPLVPEILCGVDPRFPLSVGIAQPHLEVEDTCEVLAETVLPYTNPRDGSTFASIHSDPPGIWSGNPALVRIRRGEGQVIWSGVPIESIDNEPHMQSFVEIVASLARKPFSFCSDAPAEVEVTLLKRQDNCLILNLVNMQDTKNVLPVFNFTVRVEVKNATIAQVCDIPSMSRLEFITDGDWLVIEMDRLDIYRMIRIDLVPEAGSQPCD
jgi:hypothetical protein